MKQYFTKINLTKMNLFSFIKENAKICLKTDRRALSFYLFAVLMLFSMSKTYAQCYTVTKTLLGVTPASSGVQGNIDATYRIMIVQNPSCIITGNIVVTDAIGSSTNLGTKFVKLVGLPIVVYSSPTVTVPTLNGAYDGTIANPDITINDGIMLGGDTLTYQLIAELNPRATGAGTLGNTATVLNEIPPGPPPPVEAVSNVALLPDCWTNCQLACNNDVQLSVNSMCQADVLSTMVLEGESTECAALGFYEVIIYDGSKRVSLPLNKNYIGKKLTVSVRNIVCNNTCWGTLRLEDKNPPSLTCRPRDTFSCAANLDPRIIGMPVNVANVDFTTSPWTVRGVDSCGIVYITYRDSVVNHGCSNTVLSATVYRLWCVQDSVGYQYCCRDTIDLERGTIADIIFPPHYDGLPGNAPALECNGSWDHLADNPADPKYYLPDTTVAGTGKPEGTYCGNIQYDFQDDTIQVCKGSYKLLRKWTVIDWCAARHFTHIQQIKVVDTHPPVIICPTTVRDIDTNPWTCTASIIAPVPEDYAGQNDGTRPYVINEGCSGWTYTVQHFIPANPDSCNAIGAILGQGVVTKLADGTYQLSNLTAGCQWLVYTITDGCGNSTRCAFDIYVRDLTPPVAVCQQKTVVSIGSNGRSIVPASSFNDHSHDNCGQVYLRVKRANANACSNTNFGDNVEFCCSDVGRTVSVVLEVRDGLSTTTANKSECMVDVQVQDKLEPTISCPANVTVNCTRDLTNLAVFGTATFTDNCSATLSSTVDNQLNSCNIGNIYRHFTATDGGLLKATCTQTITVVDDTPLEESNIIFPRDTILYGCSSDISSDILGKPRYINIDGCNQPVAGFEDLEFNIVDGVCAKILRRWTVIDWCLYHTNPTKATFYHTQVIKIIDREAPIFTQQCNRNDTFCILSGCSMTVSQQVTAVDSCSKTNLIWSYVIRNSAGTALYTGSSQNFTRTMTSGSYSVTWTVEDRCGNRSTCTNNFVVRDCKQPTPYCNPGIVTVIMAPGGTTVWAKDFNLGSFDNCTPNNLLKFSFSRNVRDSFKTFVCADIENGISDTLPVTIYVFDSEGNYDFCVTKIYLQDNDGVCPDITNLTNIGGAIMINTNKPAPNVPVSISDVNQNVLDQAMTNDQGHYAFPTMNTTKEYLLKPTFNKDFLNGVSTKDIVKIQKHILGIEEFSDPADMIAADPNNSKSVTARDISELRKLILGVTLKFEGRPSWEFVDATYPWDIHQPYEYNDFIHVYGNPGNYNFRAIKIGDVTGEAVTGFHSNTGVRSNTTMKFELETQQTALNTILQVPVYAGAAGKVDGFQTTLIWNTEKFDLLQITPGAFQINDGNYHIVSDKHGLVNISWNSENNQQVQSGEILFYLQLVPKVSGIFVPSDINTYEYGLTPEWYVGEDVSSVVIAERGKHLSSASAYELYQNIPNPFSGKSVISFTLPNDQWVKLSIYDVSGKSIVEYQINGKKGLNSKEIEIQSGINGILYYQLDTNEFIATRKMVVIR
ncbi:MAG: T9SS type A sorting domain-containing protein [Saprospiraceae bacterium]|nr:T9SS type A sorting domain-containing protein [Saprospiraceae bacterium]